MFNCLQLGILSVSPHQQEEVRRSLLHQAGRARQDGLQGYRSRQEGQLPSCCQPDQLVPPENTDQQVAGDRDGRLNVVA